MGQALARDRGLGEGRLKEVPGGCEGQANYFGASFCPISFDFGANEIPPGDHQPKARLCELLDAVYAWARPIAKIRDADPVFEPQVVSSATGR